MERILNIWSVIGDDTMKQCEICRELVQVYFTDGAGLAGKKGAVYCTIRCFNKAKEAQFAKRTVPKLDGEQVASLVMYALAEGMKDNVSRMISETIDKVSRQRYRKEMAQELLRYCAENRLFLTAKFEVENAGKKYDRGCPHFFLREKHLLEKLNKELMEDA